MLRSFQVQSGKFPKQKSNSTVPYHYHTVLKVIVEWHSEFRNFPGPTAFLFNWQLTYLVLHAKISVELVHPTDRACSTTCAASNPASRHPPSVATPSPPSSQPPSDLSPEDASPPTAPPLKQSAQDYAPGQPRHDSSSTVFDARGDGNSHDGSRALENENEVRNVDAS